MAAGAGNLDVDGVSTEASRVLEEVVRLPLGALPGLATIGRDIERGDLDVGVHDLHGEPVSAGTRLVLEDNGGGDAARNNLPRDVDYSLGGISELLESVGEEVEVVRTASRALIDNHGSNLVARRTSDANAGTASVGGIPIRVGERSAEDATGELVSCQGAHAAVEVTSIESSFTALGTCGRGAG